MTLYLETSSLVKLYVAEAGSREARALVESATVVSTSMVAYAQTRAAFTRLCRSGHLTPRQFTEIKHEFDAQWLAYVVLEVTAALGREAGELAERYSLRGVDALHLAPDRFCELVVK